MVEIYGSTETGVVAMRRGALDPRWRPVQGVRIESEGEGTRAWGTHFPSPQTLADQVELDAQGGFTLLGRHGDLIKIAGRRASLAGLNLLLQDLPGLTDGVFYLPATGAPAERLVLIHAGRRWTALRPRRGCASASTRCSCHGRIIRVERLPRTEGGKLPRAALDQIYARPAAQRAKPMSRVEFDFRVPADHPVACRGIFPGDPIVPGVLLLDRVMHGLQQATGLRAVAHLKQVKFIVRAAARGAGAGHLRDRWRPVLRSASPRSGDGVAVAIAEGVGSLSPQERRTA